MEYLYIPESESFLRKHCPIRSIATIWSVAELSRFLDDHTLDYPVRLALEQFRRALVRAPAMKGAGDFNFMETEYGTAAQA